MDKNCDLFRCVETGRLYMPAQNELFLYREPKQSERPPGARSSALAAKEVATAAPKAAKDKNRKYPEL